MAARVRFAPPPQGVATHTIPAGAAQNHVGLEDIMRLPLPTIHHLIPGEKPVDPYKMDIFTAASIGNLETIEELINARRSIVNDVNKSGWTALLYAAQLDHKPICEMLIAAGANLNMTSKRGQTALMLAAACGNQETAKLLLNKGADVRAKDSRGRQAIHHAAACSQHQIVENLLEKGADPNVPDNEGMTATLEACAAGHEHTLNLLLKMGGNPLARNNQGEDGIVLAPDNSKVLEIIEAAPRSLTELLLRMNLEKYEKKLREQNVDTLEVFFKLNSQDLTDMNIPYGPKKRMIGVIENYNNTGEIEIDVPESAPEVPVPAASHPLQQDTVATLRLISQHNEACKKAALAAFEHREDPVKLCQLLPEIIKCCDAIASRLARHPTT